MSEVTVVTCIPASPERAFLLATDIGLHQRSMVGTEERAVSGVTSGSIALGEHVQWKAKHFGIWWALTSEITEMVEPVFSQDEQTSGPLAYFRHWHIFEPCEGVTRMTDVVSLSALVCGFIVDRVLLVPCIKRLLTRRGLALAQMCNEPDVTPE
ncbi:MAG: SRPBCC family protein [Microbacterium enclense]